jgi:hypothetical protein
VPGSTVALDHETDLDGSTCSHSTPAVAHKANRLQVRKLLSFFLKDLPLIPRITGYEAEGVICAGVDRIQAREERTFAVAEAMGLDAEVVQPDRVQPEAHQRTST